jgi:hypothetical protein
MPFRRTLEVEKMSILVIRKRQESRTLRRRSSKDIATHTIKGFGNIKLDE